MTRTLLLLSAVLLLPLLTACNNQSVLFSDSDRVTSQKGRFWDGESAYQTTQTRRQAMQMPFGFPTGAADQ
jgi:hypothetical protein